MKKCLAFFAPFRETHFGFSSPHEKLPLIRYAMSITFFYVEKRINIHLDEHIFTILRGEMEFV